MSSGGALVGELYLLSEVCGQFLRISSEHVMCFEVMGSKGCGDQVRANVHSSC